MPSSLPALLRQLLLPLAAVLLASVIVKLDASPVRHQRWSRPCGGGEVVADSQTANISDTDTTGTEGGDASRTNEQTHLRTIETNAGTLSRMVRRLKQTYMRNNRFVNENEAHIILRTYPGPPLPNLLSPLLTASETDITLMAAYDSLARLSLYIELAKQGEERAENQRRSLDGEYDEIENDPSGGLYALLCHIKRAMVHRGINISPAAEREIRQLNVMGNRYRGTHSSIRHSEDYVTLHVLEQLLNDIVTCTSRLLQSV